MVPLQHSRGGGSGGLASSRVKAVNSAVRVTTMSLPRVADRVLTNAFFRFSFLTRALFCMSVTLLLFPKIPHGS